MPYIATNVVYSALSLALRAADSVHTTANLVAIKIDEAKCEMHNRRHFDKKHNYTRRSKR